MNVMIQEKIDQDAGFPWGQYILRPLALKIAPHCRLQANTVTWIGFAVGLLGCVGLGFGEYWSMVTGAVLINISLLIDHVDGLIARATDTVSAYGKWLDGFSGYVIEIATPVALGIGLMDKGMHFLILGLSLSLLQCFVRLLSAYYGKVFGSSLVNTKKQNIIYRIGLLYISLEFPLLLVCTLIQNYEFFLTFYILVSLGELGVICLKSLRG